MLLLNAYVEYLNNLTLFQHTSHLKIITEININYVLKFSKYHFKDLKL